MAFRELKADYIMDFEWNSYEIWKLEYIIFTR